MLYIAALLAMGILLSSCFTAPEAPENEEYLTSEPTETTASYEYEITMALVSDDYVMESWPIMPYLYSLTGIKANYKTIRPDDWEDTISRIMSNSEGYDFVELDSQSASYYKTQLFDISSYIEEYAPDYLEWAMKYPSFASDYVYGQPITYFPIREDSNIFAGCVFADPSIRGADSMDIEEFTEFMRNKKLVFKGSTKELVELMAPYFGTSTYWYTVDEQNVYGPTSDEFKAMLKVLNNFYKLGVIPEDFEFSPPSDFTESVSNNTAGIALSTEDDFEWLYEQGYKPVMLNFSTNAYIPTYADEPSKMGGIIQGTGNELTVLTFINSCFSEEGRALLNYGVDGVHTIAHNDGSIEYLFPYTQSGTYQWKEQGLTPEGLPGIYYNSWAKYSESLQSDLINLRQYLPDNDFLVPAYEIAFTSYLPKEVVKDNVENAQYEWWSAFIKGEKSTEWDWGEYLAAMNSAGCTQGYIGSVFD